MSLLTFAQASYTYTTYAPPKDNTYTISPWLVMVSLVVLLLVVVSLWKIFEKAGRPGWAAIIPIYNIIVLLQIVGKPVWWLIWYFIPVANFIVHFVVALNLAKAFGKSSLYGFFLLWLLPFIGYVMLGFGSDSYRGRRLRSRA